MNEQELIQITNRCPDEITINLRYLRPKIKKIGHPTSITLKPGQKTPLLPEHILVGARGWDTLRTRTCILIEAKRQEPAFVQLINHSKDSLNLEIKLPTKKTKKATRFVKLSPGKRSRIVFVRSISHRKQFESDVKNKKIEVLPVFDIGPATGRGKSVGSYINESVYTCDECGGPIVFRFSPPVPIHI
jgi:hypothetical protein